MFCLKKSLTAVKENPKQTCMTENTYLKTCIFRVAKDYTKHLLKT